RLRLSIVPYTTLFRSKWPLYLGFLSYIVSCVLLISIKGTGVLGYVMLFASILLESLGASVLNMLRESLVAIHVDPIERSGILALDRKSTRLNSSHVSI